jgi:hypothetical protein
MSTDTAAGASFATDADCSNSSEQAGLSVDLLIQPTLKILHFRVN